MMIRSRSSFTRRGLFGIALGALAVFQAPQAHALSTSEAETFVSGVVSELRALVENGTSGAAGAAQFLALLEERSSLDAVGKFAMGLNWREMSDAQKAAYNAAFRSYISQTYQNRFGEYAGEEIVLNGAVDAGRKGVLVKSLLKRPQGQDIVVEWLVSDRSGATLLSDVVFEGVSLAITLRATFGGMVETRGGDIDKFIADLAASKGA